MAFPCPRHGGCVQLDTYGYPGEYIENQGQHGHVDLYPLPSKPLLQVLRHGDNSCCDVNRQEYPAESQQWPDGLLKRQRIKAQDSTHGNSFPPVLSAAILRKQKGSVPCNVFEKQTDFFSLLRRRANSWRNYYNSLRSF